MLKTCLSKEAYRTLEIAQRVKEKREKATGVALRIYACGRHYHLTSMVSHPPDMACNDDHCPVCCLSDEQTGA